MGNPFGSTCWMLASAAATLVPGAELDGGLGEVGAALGEQPGQRGGEQRAAVALDVGVVLGLFRAVDDLADDLHR